VKNGWTGGQHSVFRALFGLYLLIHFVGLLPWSSELFSNRGVLPDASASPLIARLWAYFSASPMPRRSLRSAPAQKPGPFAASTITRASLPGSAATAARAIACESIRPSRSRASA